MKIEFNNIVGCLDYVPVVSSVVNGVHLVAMGCLAAGFFSCTCEQDCSYYHKYLHEYLTDARQNPACLLVKTIPVIGNLFALIYDVSAWWFGGRSVCKDETGSKRSFMMSPQSSTRGFSAQDAMCCEHDTMSAGYAGSPCMSPVSFASLNSPTELETEPEMTVADKGGGKNVKKRLDIREAWSPSHSSNLELSGFDTSAGSLVSSSPLKSILSELYDSEDSLPQRIAERAVLHATTALRTAGLRGPQDGAFS